MNGKERIWPRIAFIAFPIAIMATILSLRIGGSLRPLEVFALAMAATSITILIMNRKRRPRDRS